MLACFRLAFADQYSVDYELWNQSVVVLGNCV